MKRTRFLILLLFLIASSMFEKASAQINHNLELHGNKKHLLLDNSKDSTQKKDIKSKNWQFMVVTDLFLPMTYGHLPNLGLQFYWKNSLGFAVSFTKEIDVLSLKNKKDIYIMLYANIRIFKNPNIVISFMKNKRVVKYKENYDENASFSDSNEAFSFSTGYLHDIGDNRGFLFQYDLNFRKSQNASIAIVPSVKLIYQFI